MNNWEEKYFLLCTEKDKTSSMEGVDIDIKILKRGKAILVTGRL
jgi:hypothetical protein